MSVLALILAGGAGSRLSILGEKRAKPAVPFAGKYRIIDFPLSHAVNSDLYRGDHSYKQDYRHWKGGAGARRHHHRSELLYRCQYHT